MSGHPASHRFAAWRRGSAITDRRYLFCGVVVVGVLNGASDRIADAVARAGFIDALLATFGISVVVWLAVGVAIWLIMEAEVEDASTSDFMVSGAASAVFLVPVPQLSWLAIMGLSLYLMATSSGPLRRAAAILCALTIPVLWSRALFAVFSGPILTLDAKLVSWIIGTQADGNAVPFVDGSGVVFLLPACSSLTNVSLAILCGVVIVKFYNLSWSREVVLGMALACLATVVINVARISSIGLMPAYYDLIHGTVGVTIAEWTTNLSVLAIYAAALHPHEQTDTHSYSRTSISGFPPGIALKQRAGAFRRFKETVKYSSCYFGLLLASAISLKVMTGVGHGAATASSSSEDIVELLKREGFSISRAASNTDPQWVYGVRGTCKLQIADISIQGWHRSAMEWEVRDRHLLYSVEGKLYRYQPILWPMVVHYFRRVERYIGLEPPQVLARAVIIDPACPSDPIPVVELEKLS